MAHSKSLTAEKEFEAKALVTRAELSSICGEYQVLPDDFHWQKNIYLDTEDNFFKNHDSALRIRLTEQHSVVTLKSQAADHHQEWTQLLDDEDLESAEEQIYSSNSWTLPEKLYDSFKSKTVNFPLADDLLVTAELETKRATFNLPSGQMMLDISHYYGETDYEVEIESDSEEQAQQILTDILANHHIPFRPSRPKIARAIASKSK